MDSKENGLEVNADKTKYKDMYRDQNAGRRHSITTDDSSFERVEEFKYLGKTLRDQYSIQEKMNSVLNSGNACYLFRAESFDFQFAIQTFKD